MSPSVKILCTRWNWVWKRNCQRRRISPQKSAAVQAASWTQKMAPSLARWRNNAPFPARLHCPGGIGRHESASKPRTGSPEQGHSRGLKGTSENVVTQGHNFLPRASKGHSALVRKQPSTSNHQQPASNHQSAVSSRAQPIESYMRVLLFFYLFVVFHCAPMLSFIRQLKSETLIWICSCPHNMRSLLKYHVYWIHII